MKAPALAASQRLLDDGMAAAADLEGVAVVEHGPGVVLPRRKLGEARLAVELGKRGGERAERLLLGGDGRGKLGEHLLLDGERALGRGDDAALGLHQFR